MCLLCFYKLSEGELKKKKATNKGEEPRVLNDSNCTEDKTKVLFILQK